MSSRTAILDRAYLISNLNALYDHLLEEELNLEGEKEEVSGDDTALLLSIESDLNQNKADRDFIQSKRREIQGLMFETFGLDQEQWCKLKHYMSILGAVDEVASSTDNPNLNRISKEMRSHVYSFLARAGGYEGVGGCGRCLADAFNTK